MVIKQMSLSRGLSVVTIRITTLKRRQLGWLIDHFVGSHLPSWSFPQMGNYNTAHHCSMLVGNYEKCNSRHLEDTSLGKTVLTAEIIKFPLFLHVWISQNSLIEYPVLTLRKFHSAREKCIIFLKKSYCVLLFKKEHRSSIYTYFPKSPRIPSAQISYVLFFFF